MVLTWKELIERAKSEIREISTADLNSLMQRPEPLIVIDVREHNEFVQGHLPGAMFIPRGSLELRIESAAPDRNQEICLYCGRGNRSALAARSLQEMGYTHVYSLAEGISQWRKEGRSIEFPREPDIDPQLT
jgi:sulfur-carrier protein adenylyltransferase/sulfurtransferase